MKRGLSGYFVPLSLSGEEARAFVPHPLPPKPPPLLDETLSRAQERATFALGRLDGLAAALPDSSLLLYAYVRKEAVLSSQIEGTQSSLSDLLLYESDMAPGVPIDDVEEVSNYVAAIKYGLSQLDSLPISVRLLKHIHAILLRGGRGSNKEPGELRQSQNWIGGTRPGNALFVPPPPDQVIELLGKLEIFLHEPGGLPVLAKAGLAHAQFETIHPFLDGNGRLGRLLITLLLCAEGALRQPLLYFSLYFKQHRSEYYDLLQRVRTEGDWEAWLRFFFTAVEQTANEAVNAARLILDTFYTDRARIKDLGRAAGSALRVHDALQRAPLASIGKLAQYAGMNNMTATTATRNLQRLGIVREITGGRYGKVYAYTRYVELLNEGLEPI